MESGSGVGKYSGGGSRLGSAVGAKNIWGVTLEEDSFFGSDLVSLQIVLLCKIIPHE
jgi:hypothetical protein